MKNLVNKSAFYSTECISVSQCIFFKASKWIFEYFILGWSLNTSLITGKWGNEG